MQFPRAATMIASAPSDDEPYYSVRGGSNMEERFVTSYWFHVYVHQTGYEIKFWDVATDREMSLDEWRKEKNK
jgi:hypothetical protein